MRPNYLNAAVVADISRQFGRTPVSPDSASAYMICARVKRGQYACPDSTSVEILQGATVVIEFRHHDLAECKIGGTYGLVHKKFDPGELEDFEIVRLSITREQQAELEGSTQHRYVFTYDEAKERLARVLAAPQYIS